MGFEYERLQEDYLELVKKTGRLVASLPTVDVYHINTLDDDVLMVIAETDTMEFSAVSKRAEPKKFKKLMRDFEIGRPLKRKKKMGKKEGETFFSEWAKAINSIEFRR